MSRKKCSSIGGQAVIEGVMMRGAGSAAVAVRDPEGKIQLETERFTPLKERNVVYRIPFIRGIFNFINSIGLGMKLLSRSAEVYGEDMGEPGKAELWMQKHFHIDLIKLTTIIGVILGLVFAVVLFIVVPQYLAKLIWLAVGGLRYNLSDRVYNLIDAVMAGVFKIGVFVLYIALISLMKDIKRVFMYHGAEHKVIACYEHDLELNTDNAKKMSRLHDRCGTSFIFIVLTVSILFFAVFFSLVPIEQTIYKVLIRIAFIPLIAGISYELLKYFAKFDNGFVKVLKAPGLLLQRLTTAEPTGDMLEVSLTAFKRVLEMEENKELPDVKFIMEVSVSEAKSALTEKGISENEAEIILMSVTSTKTRSELSMKKTVTMQQVATAKRYAEDRKTGKPLQYVLKNACFYGLDLKVDKNVLIPRPETETLVSEAISFLKNIENAKVLDLCTGSGAIAVAIAKNTKASVVATDISEGALSIAKENIENNKVNVKTLKSDLFNEINDKFDLITSNPPYVKSGEMEFLDGVVREYEPRLALDGGADGLDFYRKIAKEAYGYLTQKGAIIFEVGYDQAQAVKEMLSDNFDVEIILDIMGVSRVVKGVIK